jgi:hypothetical protein
MWEERISQDTHPSIVLEHVLRYRAVVPIIRRSSVWADLGAGAGVAAGRVLDEPFHGSTIVVDREPAALDVACDELATKTARVMPIVADLASGEGIERVARELRSHGGGAHEGCITCFELIEHLENVVPILELLREATTECGYTAAVSVPNDAFWSIENPHHQTVWGDRSLNELVRLLPEPVVIAHQFPLFGSCLVRTTEEGPVRRDLRVQLSRDGIPSHYLIAFGHHADLLGSPAEAAQGELERQRGWERQREAHLAFLEQRELELMWLLSQCEAELSKTDTARQPTDGRARTGLGTRLFRAS